MTVTGRDVISSEEPDAPEARRSSVIRELERYGYIVERHSLSAPGAICRHSAAPPLLVAEDGRLELLEGQRGDRITMPTQLSPRRIYRGRALLFLALLALATFVGLLLVAMIVG